MDTPGQDVESVTGMVAGGAQIVLFSTGLGTPVGCPIAPVLKITGNQDTAIRMAEHIDFNVAPILRGAMSVEDGGTQLLRVVLDCANGRLTKAEKLGHGEFGIHRIGPTL
jgi:altronate dehydratase large subunit